MARPRVDDSELCLNLLATAAELVASLGAETFSLRQLAAVAGTFTSAVYSLFGGKAQLLEAVILQGFSAFRAAQGAAVSLPASDAVARLRSLGIAYRQWALENSALFTLMFSGTLDAYLRSPGSQAARQESMLPLLETVARGQSSGALRQEDPETVAMNFWGTVHGLVTLELPGAPCRRTGWWTVYQAALESTLRMLRA
ncbi:MAG: TetR/AcrR family transcriptional regulator [Chloroflexota bacterium]|nr:TetR/AcrR family transcriptional regulator [Chloroflexota bacterium]